MSDQPIVVNLLVDPASEASWRASRWLTIVSLARPVDLTLILAPSDAGRSVARVGAAAGDLVGADAPSAVYEAYGRRRYVLGEQEGEALDGALTDLHLPSFLGFATGDAKWDAALATPSEAPLTIDGKPHALPDLAEIPTGAAASELFDRLAGPAS